MIQSKVKLHSNLDKNWYTVYVLPQFDVTYYSALNTPQPFKSYIIRLGWLLWFVEIVVDMSKRIK